MATAPGGAGRNRPLRRILVALGLSVAALGVALALWFGAFAGGTVHVSGVGFVYPGACPNVGTSTSFPVYFHESPAAVFNLSWTFECVLLGNGSGIPPPTNYTAESVTATTPGFAVLSSTLPSTFDFEYSGSVQVEVRAPSWPGNYELEFSVTCY